MYASYSNHVFTKPKRKQMTKSPVKESSIYHLPTRYLSNAKPERIIMKGKSMHSMTHTLLADYSLVKQVVPHLMTLNSDV
jgi:hypothetical protein